MSDISNMSDMLDSCCICKICEEDPTSHSFKIVGTYNNIIYYYTCPAEATKYYDTEGIVNHYDLLLSSNKNKWAWIFDCKGFSSKHLLEIKVGIELAKLITSKHSDRLEKIVIINKNIYINTIIALIYPFLNTTIQNKITIL